MRENEQLSAMSVAAIRMALLRHLGETSVSVILRAMIGEVEMEASVTPYLFIIYNSLNANLAERTRLV